MTIRENSAYRILADVNWSMAGLLAPVPDVLAVTGCVMHRRRNMWDPHPDNNDWSCVIQWRSASRRENPFVLIGTSRTVVFFHSQSTEPWLELERNATPRENFWDVLLEYAGAGGVHYRDPVTKGGLELSGIVPPDCSGGRAVHWSRPVNQARSGVSRPRQECNN